MKNKQRAKEWYYKETNKKKQRYKYTKGNV